MQVFAFYVSIFKVRQQFLSICTTIRISIFHTNMLYLFIFKPFFEFILKFHSFMNVLNRNFSNKKKVLYLLHDLNMRLLSSKLKFYNFALI